MDVLIGLLWLGFLISVAMFVFSIVFTVLMYACMALVAIAISAVKGLAKYINEKN